MVSVCNGDLKEARSYAQHLAAVGLPQVDEEDLLIRAIGCARALAAAIKASEAACPGFSYHCQREVAVTLASDLADLGMARWKAHDEDQAQQYMSQALSALSDPQVVLDSFETSLFRSCAEKLHQVITETSACAVKAQASAPSLELAAAIDAFNNQHGELTANFLPVLTLPTRALPRQPWVNLAESLGDRTCNSSYGQRPRWRQRYRRVLPFDEARRCVQAIGFASREEWDEWVAEGKKSPFLGPYVPSDPEAMYAEEWQGWGDFLGVLLLYQEADAVRLRALRLPALPSIVYKEEWQGYEDWLGLGDETLYVPREWSK
ncbi:unnamed protein product [Effrenium voratum]|nr:unnamed protein product [Effrenium voratum]